MDSIVFNDPRLCRGDDRPRRSDYQPINDRQVATEFCTRERICLITLYSLVIISSSIAIYCGYVIVPSIIIVMISIGFCAYEPLKNLVWSRCLSYLEIICCCYDTPQLGLVPQQRFLDPSLHESLPEQFLDRLGVQEPHPQLPPVFMQRRIWRDQRFYDQVSPYPISSSEDESLLAAPSSVDESSLAAPSSVDESSLAAPSSVDESSLAAPSSVDESVTVTVECR